MILETNVSGQTNYSIISNLTFNPNGNEQERDLVRGVFFLIFTIGGVVLNLFIVVAVRNRRILNVRNILLIHLGSVGLAASILCLLFAAVVSFSGWSSGYWTVCQAQGLLQAILTQVTTWTLAAISWDKYQTIVSPFQHSNVRTD
ncbi:hypothetical protein FSP39_005655 [Pinctada imbricata]|uniref:G-protein coupled receptors family 1 profile domain-containing protein n=1 Tax=Pinctada imbricata TaxID=66713 RepID=A0AA89BHP6_PINIB|nr:hypothetical protein FSP39_005655 [Pinctada imbricata]